MISMRALECLVAIVEQGSLTQAAAVLHISQPALSHQIAAIERELGTPVIERLPRGIRPTAAGLAAVAEARIALAAADRAVVAGRRVAAGTGGRIRIACAETHRDRRPDRRGVDRRPRQAARRGRPGGLDRLRPGRGGVADLDRDALRLSFDVKVLGPLMLAKHLAPRMSEGGSFVLFSGVAATKITVGALGVAITNAAADTLARSLALELAPIRVNAISPGVIDSGAWDALGEEGKEKYYADVRARNPARRIGTTDDVANTVLFAMSSTFLTGQTLHIDAVFGVGAAALR